MDKLELKFFEKRELQKEVNLIKKQLRKNNGGVYLSSGAVIIIIYAYPFVYLF